MKWELVILIMNDTFCLSETPLTPATLARHRHIIPFWNQDDPRIDVCLLDFGPEAQLAFCSME